ncbi:MAG: BTAD domain-containing putative transcriptional regulator [Caldilineaceae bacterium]
MPHLTLTLLGGFQAYLDDAPLTNFASNKVRALLIYLVLEAERAHNRSQLAGLFWPDLTEQRARTYLRHALTNLRQLLQDAESTNPFLLVTRQTLQFNRASSHTCDALSMAALLPEKSESLGADNASQLASVLMGYAAPLLAGFYLDGCAEFEAWLLLTRERLQRQVIDALQWVAAHYEEGRDWRQAIALIQRAVELEPWREESHRQLMRLLAASRQRSAALAQYERCAELLRRELGVEPGDETVALYQRIVEGKVSAPRGDGAAPTREATALNADDKPAPTIGNLPTPLTPLVGREEEVVAVVRIMQQNGARLVTLTGPGGVGKTRLAIAATWDLAPHFRDGVYWVELAAIEAPELVVSAIAQTIGVSLRGERAPEELLKDELRRKQMLLSLDNYEHLLEAAPLVAELLLACPALCILTTSRERLNLHGEQEYVVGPLPVPARQQPGDAPVDLTHNPAIALFYDRARAVKYDFALSPDNAAAVASICIHVDGLPLAIELAAARIKFMAPDALLERLTTNGGAPRFLNTDMRNIPRRHRSVWDTVAWSYSLLAPSEQALFRRLAVFVGGFTVEAVTEACNVSDDPIQIEGMLTSLVDKSLLQVMGHTDAEVRLDMLEMVRHFGLEVLAQLEELDSVKKCHAHYYADYVARLDPNQMGPNGASILAETRINYPNLRAAFRWFHAHGDVNRCVELCDLYSNFWNVAHDRDALVCLKATLELLSTELPSGGYVEVLASMGHFTSAFHSRLAGRPYFERALAMYEQIGNGANPQWVGMAHGLLGWILFDHEADYQGAYAYVEKSRKLGAASGDKWAFAMTFANQGHMAIKLMEFTFARELLEEGLALHRQNGDPWAIALTALVLGSLYVLQEEYANAAPVLAEGKRLARTIKSHGLLCYHDYILAIQAIQHGAFEEVQSLLRNALLEGHRTNNEQTILERLDACVLLAIRTNQPHKTLHLAAAIDALQRERQLISAPLSAQRIAESVAAARSQLSEAEAEAAWAEGAAMTLEETVAYATTDYVM